MGSIRLQRGGPRAAMQHRQAITLDRKLSKSTMNDSFFFFFFRSLHGIVTHVLVLVLCLLRAGCECASYFSSFLSRTYTPKCVGRQRCSLPSIWASTPPFPRVSVVVWLGFAVGTEEKREPTETLLYQNRRVLLYIELMLSFIKQCYDISVFGQRRCRFKREEGWQRRKRRGDGMMDIWQAGVVTARAFHSRAERSWVRFPVSLAYLEEYFG